MKDCLDNPNEDDRMLCEDYSTDETATMVECLSGYPGTPDEPKCIGYISYRVEGTPGPIMPKTWAPSQSSASRDRHTCCPINYFTIKWVAR